VLKSRSILSRRFKLGMLVLVFIFGAAFRTELAGKEPYLSTDAYRYVWDGRVQSRHINPFRYFPRDPRLAFLREGKVFPNINGADYERTPYPPAAEMVYLGVYLIHPLSVNAFKTAFLVFDLITILALMAVLARAGLDPARAIVYAWHPLIIWEGAHSGHVDVVFITFLSLALLAWAWKKPALTGVALALASLVKLYPALLLPVFLTSSDRFLNNGDDGSEKPDREKVSLAHVFSKAPAVVFSRTNIITLISFVATILICYLPYLAGGSGALVDAQGYLQEEGFVNKGGRYMLLGLLRRLGHIPTPVYIAGALVTLAAAALWWLAKDKLTAVDVARGCLAMVGLYLLLTTPRYPWYFCWLVPFLAFVPEIAWFYLTGATVLLYTLWFIPNEYPQVPLWLGASLYLPTLILLARNYHKRRERGKSLEAVTA
ncbi:MAG: glycosyltransferase 87 family protein, partial [Blastocatellia bacterium]